MTNPVPIDENLRVDPWRTSIPVSTMFAYEDDDGTNAVWHLHAYAICANEF